MTMPRTLLTSTMIGEDATFDSVLSEQREKLRLLKRVVPNFKRLGRAKMTNGATQGRIEAIKSYFEASVVFHQLLQKLSTDEDKSDEYFTGDEFAAAEEQYFDDLGYLYDHLRSLEPAPAPPANANATPNQTNAGPTQVKFNKVNLPKFSGEPTDWDTFCELFESMIHNNAALPKIQKFHYLRESLSGEALSLIDTKRITERNYDSAWQYLKTRYNDESGLIWAYLKSLFEIPAMSDASGKELQRLVDTTRRAREGLLNLQRPVATWDDVLVYLTVGKLDIETRQHFELHSGSVNAFPTFDNVAEFLDDRARRISRLPALVSSPSSDTAKATQKKTVKTLTATASEVPACPSCKKTHSLAACVDFREKSLEDRHDFVKQSHLCFNCLKLGHSVNECSATGRCKKCKRKHHTLLHGANGSKGSPAAVIQTGDAKTQPSTSSSSHATTVAVTTSLPSALIAEGSVSAHHSSQLKTDTKFASLGTARVRLRATSGRTLTIRALVDPGSQITIATESVAQALRAPRSKTHLAISGVDNVSTTSHSTISFFIEPCDTRSPSIPVCAFVLPRLTPYAPRRAECENKWAHLKGLRLADPDTSSAGKIELLIGADLYAAILRDGVRRGELGSPVAQETIFGWVISGPRSDHSETSSHLTLAVHHCTLTEPLDATLRRFWEIEEVNLQIGLTEEEEICENHFLATHQRDCEGRYIVRLPFKSPLSLDLGDSYSIAKKCLLRQEGRLALQPQRQAEYSRFLDFWIILVVYLPHHAIIRTDSATSPIRVVFNASSATSNGKSLNDQLYIGPQLLPSLLKIILQWRMHRVALRADIEKMFRQITVHPDERHLQRILHRSNPESPIISFDLCTVTYGTGPAPWLANRVLKQLARDEQLAFPRAARVLESDFYVDDALTGADTIEEAIALRRELQALLLRGGFNLRKWASSHPEALKGVDASPLNSLTLPLDQSDAVKVLGVLWDVKLDVFRFRTTLSEPGLITKRTCLSVIARIFDPVGWLTPTTITAKIFIQELWIHSIDWDEDLPTELLRQWNSYYRELPSLQEITIPRFIGLFKDSEECELHAFADASTRAYATVVYLRVVHNDGEITVALLLGKSKVAPTKQLSVARLELCAAHLVARVVEQVQSSMTLKDVPVYAWSDSEIVLAWLRKHASQWPTFIANRVSDIQSRLPKARWRHVSSGDNPADCASRGLSPSKLVGHALWWHGPPWLKAHASAWPRPRLSPDAALVDEEHPPPAALLAGISEEICDIHERISTWPKLLRVTAYCLLARYSIARLRDERPTMTQAVERARIFWISQIQGTEFAEEISALRRGKPLPRRSSLLRLHPFLDEKGQLRVGGRLSSAQLPFEEKHPLILPNHRITGLIIEQAHLRALHGGPQLTTRTLRQQYWILGGRRLVRSAIHKCVKCARYRAQPTTQLMGDLPEERVNKTRPFLHSGVDYAGPFHIRCSKGRGQRSYKGYVALFVCLSVRAIHLELVSDYTTQAFLAAFRRFVSRRGLPRHMYSDNGMNFVGADRELSRTFRALQRDPNLTALLATDSITWHFIPASAPHFGGLWEAGVKTMKFHLKRLLEETRPTFEEMATLLAQVEANLNSRPISPLSEDPQDLAALTPGHFLVHGPLTAVPEESLLDENTNRLSRWQLLQQLSESFWRRWKNEYLHTLQQRNKWFYEKDNVKINDLVLVRDQQSPPSKWPLGRIVALHPGPDGAVRVVTVKTSTSTLKRPITKLIPLNVEPARSMAGGRLDLAPVATSDSPPASCGSSAQSDSSKTLEH